MDICVLEQFGLKVNKMWTLILTIIMVGGGVNSEIATVPGFETNQQCIDAGKLWYNDTKNTLPEISGLRGDRKYSYTCVKVK